MLQSIKLTENPTNPEEEYLHMIKSLESKHDQNLQETIAQYTERCESLYAYIKDAERLLDDMDRKRKTERKEMQRVHEREIEKITKKYNHNINGLKKKIAR